MGRSKNKCSNRGKGGEYKNDTECHSGRRWLLEFHTCHALGNKLITMEGVRDLKTYSWEGVGGPKWSKYLTRII
jgi:hypothetical protein